MAVRSKTLARGQAAGAGTTTVYTVSSGETAILKEALFYRASTGTSGAVQIRLSAPGLTSTPLWVATLGQGVSTRVELWTVLPPTATIAITVTGDGPVNYWLSGAELAGVAD